MAQNIWIVTIGSSDVQFRDLKGQSYDNLWWNEWYPTIEHQLHGNSDAFQPSETKQITWGEPGEESEKITYRLPARVLGLAYNALPEQVGKYLTFPLLEKFAQQLKEEQVTPTKIVVILTNQNNFFTKEDKEKDACPFWQDTCFLKRALADCFFGSDDYGFKGVEIKWIVLSPRNNDDQKYGLDDWNRVLDLVKTKFRAFKEKQKLELKPGDKVYVSHQAGTPAISSAVQFVCLAEFEKPFQAEETQPQQTVRFLMSNEYGSSTKPIESSEYLRGIRKQEASALLKRHDYSGIKTLIGHYLSSCDQLLLEAAIQWNHAKFDKFCKTLKDKRLSEKYSELVELVRERTKRENWWWTAYEAANLGFVRLLRQENTVDAMFHSFRAVEGLLSTWFKEYEKSLKKSGKPKLPRNEKGLIKLPKEVVVLDKKGDEEKRTLATSYGQGLYCIIASIETVNEDSDLWVFGNFVFHRRNQLFHQLEGLQDKDAVFMQWKSSQEQSLDEQGWKERVVNCLNFVSDQQFGSIEEASLMVKVHRELESAIEAL